MAKTKFNISEVHRLTGKARSTIAKHMDNGELPFGIGSDGKRFIEASDLMRVYRDLVKVDENGNLQYKTKRTENNDPGNSKESRHLEELLTFEKQERERERRQLQATIDHLRDDLEKSHDRESRVTLLLENHSRDADQLEKQFAAIEKRVADYERDVERYRRALKHERSKSLWQRIFS